MNVTLSLLILLTGYFATNEPIYQTETGSVEFRSEAPLELIRASSETLRGVLDLEKRQFAFSVGMNSFEGFNSPLQQEHFRENYLETGLYPVATFTGKIIDEVPFDRPGSYPVRTKGNFTVHGVVQERIIKGILVVEENSISIRSEFEVRLVDHDIRVPKIVRQKIAESIRVSLNCQLTPRA